MALFSFQFIAEFLFAYNSESFFIYRELLLKKFNILFMVSPHDNLQTLNTRIDLYENLRQSLSSICLSLRFLQGHLHLKCQISWDISEIRHLEASVFHKICYQFRILCIILHLAVGLNFLCLLYRIWIYLYHTDSV